METKKLPVIFACDFNTDPSTAAFQHFEKLSPQLKRTYTEKFPCECGFDKAAFDKASADTRKALLDDKCKHCDENGLADEYSTYKWRKGGAQKKKLGVTKQKIDYILFSKDAIECVGKLSLPTAKVVEKECPLLLPGWKYPSDHLMLGADLLFKTERQIKAEHMAEQQTAERQRRERKIKAEQRRVERKNAAGGWAKSKLAFKNRSGSQPKCRTEKEPVQQAVLAWGSDDIADSWIMGFAKAMGETPVTATSAEVMSWAREKFDKYYEDWKVKFHDDIVFKVSVSINGKKNKIFVQSRNTIKSVKAQAKAITPKVMESLDFANKALENDRPGEMVDGKMTGSRVMNTCSYYEIEKGCTLTFKIDMIKTEAKMRALKSRRVRKTSRPINRLASRTSRRRTRRVGF